MGPNRGPQRQSHLRISEQKTRKQTKIIPQQTIGLFIFYKPGKCKKRGDTKTVWGKDLLALRLFSLFQRQSPFVHKPVRETRGAGSCCRIQGAPGWSLDGLSCVHKNLLSILQILTGIRVGNECPKS